MSDPQPQVLETPGAYIYFVLSAFALTLIGGPLIGVMIWMSRSGIAMAGRETALVQAHGWAQLLGWAGLFVAGFSLRLVPRFAGRPERSPTQATTILGLLVAGTLLRLAGLAAGGSWSWVTLVGSASAAAGMLGIGSSLFATLRQNRHPDATWAMLAWFGAAWWAVGAVVLVVNGIFVMERGVAPALVDRAGYWVFLLGGIGSFVWAMQSRMMPISFGRGPVSRRSLLVPTIAYNAGAILILLAAPARYIPSVGVLAPGLLATGLGVVGAAISWLASVCGSLGGRAHRLRPASQPLARFIVWANRWAVLGGLMLILFSIRGLLPGPIARMDLEDAALHALGAGLITILIAGMLQLVAPVFAMERMGETRTAKVSAVVWALLMAAAATRVAAALFPSSFTTLVGMSALAGWIGLALLAATLIRIRVQAGVHLGKMRPG